MCPVQEGARVASPDGATANDRAGHKTGSVATLYQDKAAGG